MEYAALRERRTGMPLSTVHAQIAALLGAGRGRIGGGVVRCHGGAVIGLQ